jgi:MOSC domain-containing protein
MTGIVTSLWRHPIKSHGRERLDNINLIAGQTMPGDRVWAVAHEHARADNGTWAPCVNFSRGAKAPALMAIDARLDDTTGIVTLSHPDLDDLRFDPERQAAALLAWVAPLMPKDRAASARIVRVPGRGMTDSEFASVSLCNMGSHGAVEKQIQQDLSILRWRGNIWLDRLEPWAEFGWIGREIQIGDAVLHVRERITRCAATTANPETGQRDADTLGTLEHWGHRDFGVYAEVIRDGRINTDDKVQLL